MEINSDLRAQAAIIGHAIFADGNVTQYLRPGIDEHAQTFATWQSGAAIFTRRTEKGMRQVLAIALFRQAPGSDQATIARLLQADFADNPTTQALSRQEELSLSTVLFDSHSIPVPLPGKVAENIYAQIYHQYHDGSNN